MTRLNVLLALALVLSSLYLVNVSYDSRRLFVALEKLQSESHALDVEYTRLDAERRAQATNLRVEKLARERLEMRPAAPGVTLYVNAPAPAAAAAAPVKVAATPAADHPAAGARR